MATATGFKKLEEKVAAGKPLTLTESNIVKRASTPAVPKAAPVAPVAPIAPSAQPFTYNGQQYASIADIGKQQPVQAAPVAPTFKDKAANALNAEFQGVADIATEYGIGEGVASSLQESVDQYKAQQKAKQEYLNTQQGLQAQGEYLQTNKAERESAAGIAGAEAKFAQGREGPTSTGAPLALNQYKTIAQEQMSMFQNQLSQSRAARAEQQRQLQFAEQEGNTQLASQIKSRLVGLEREERQYALDAANLEDKQAERLLKEKQFEADTKIAQTNSVVTQFDKMGAGLVGLSAEALTAMVSGTNITPGAALAYQAGAKIEADAAKVKDADEHAKMLLQAKQLKGEIANINSTPQTKTFEYYNSLSLPGQAKFKELLTLNNQMQIIKVANEDGSETAYGLDPVTGKTVPLPKPIGSDSGNLPSEPPATQMVGAKNVTAQPIFLSALEKADADMFAATGKHIDVNQSFRTSEQQAALYDKLSAKGARVAEPGHSYHERGLAVDVTNWKEAQPYLEKYGVVNGLKGDMGHFSMGELNPDIFGGQSSADKAASEIMKPFSTATITTYPKKQQDKIVEILNKKKAEALASGDDMGAIRASAGGKQVEGTAVESFAKAKNVLSQLGNLESTVMGMDTGPIIGAFKSANPYDVDAVKLKAELQAIVPNLARGIYGEVGVLTDQDINNYIQTLPNAKSTDDQKKALLNMTKKIIKDSISNKAATYAELGYDVSGLANTIEKISPKAPPMYSVPEDNPHVNNL